MPVVFGTAKGNKVPPTIILAPTGGSAKSPAYGYLGPAGGGKGTFLSPTSSPPSPPPPSPPPSSLTVTPNPVNSAQTDTYTAGKKYTYGGSCTISGGTPPYTTSWSSQTSTGSGQSGQVELDPTGPGTYQGSIYFSVTDSAGASGGGTCNFRLTVS